MQRAVWVPSPALVGVASTLDVLGQLVPRWYARVPRTQQGAWLARVRLVMLIWSALLLGSLGGSAALLLAGVVPEWVVCAAAALVLVAPACAEVLNRQAARATRASG